MEAISQLKSHKTDDSGDSTNHLKLASPAISKTLALFFSSKLHHDYMPNSCRDCVLVPISKENIDASCSHNYSPIALSSNLSKVLERLLLLKYEKFFFSNQLQFGFKPGYSTMLCTGMIKNVISRCIHNGSAVLSCFLDASKAFDMVDHDIHSRVFMDRGLPLPVLQLLLSWYSSQQMCVHWDDCISDPFGVSNGVWQGSIFSPVLFAVYLDGLLEELTASGIGWFWGMFVCRCILLCRRYCFIASLPMLDICSSYTACHKLEFNASKIRLICFHLPPVHSYDASIFFNGVQLQYTNKVLHLGHFLSPDLSDTDDILCVVKDLNCKANSILCNFH